MKKRYYFLLLHLLLACFTLSAQTGKDQIIFQAMQDEMQRNLEELSLPGIEKPFFIAYAIEEYSQYELSASLGAITSVKQTGPQMVGSVRLFLGDYKLTSDSKYLGRFQVTPMPVQADYDLIRQYLWLGSDAAYKNAAKELTAKLTARKKDVLTEEEARLTDFVRVSPVQKIVRPEKKFVVDLPKWEKSLRELSAIFLDYPELFNTSVTLTTFDMQVYLKTSEGSTVLQPVRFVALKAEGSARTDDGIVMKDAYSALACVPDELPSLEELKQKIAEFASDFVKLRKAEPIKEFYCGPVLFEQGAAAAVLKNNLLTQNSLFAYRKPEDLITAMQNKIKPIASRIGMKIIDNRITVKSYSSRKEYNGKPLYGAYEIDAEGVIPPAEMTLVENGIFKKMLNGRIPAINCEESTGSSRYYAYPKEVLYTTAPGTLHISVNKGSKPEMLKKQLIKLAKEDGLSYAYIVRGIDETTSTLYRVDLKDGKETLMRSGDISPIELKNLRRLAGISTQENVTEFMLDDYVLTSMIYPSALLIEDIEINKTAVAKESAPALPLPWAEKTTD